MDGLFERAARAAWSGDRDAAIGLLESGLAAGDWCGAAMLAAPVFDPLRADPRFVAVVLASAVAERAAVGVVPDRPLICPQGPTSGLVLALHGNGGDVAEAMVAWAPVTGAGWCLAAVGSSQWVAAGRGGWDDEARADADVAAGWAGLSDARRLVVAGYSLGAETGLRAVLAGRLPAIGVLALATAGEYIADLDRWRPLLGSPPAGLRVWFAVGDADIGGARAGKHEQLAGMLRDAGVGVRLLILPGVGHEYPDGFVALVPDALAWVAGNQPRAVVPGHRPRRRGWKRERNQPPPASPNAPDGGPARPCAE